MEKGIGAVFFTMYMLSSHWKKKEKKKMLACRKECYMDTYITHVRIVSMYVLWHYT